MRRLHAKSPADRFQSPVEVAELSGMMGGSDMRPGTTKDEMPSIWPGNLPRALRLYTEGGHVILKQSEAGDTLWGYSERLGKWSRGDSHD